MPPAEPQEETPFVCRAEFTLSDPKTSERRRVAQSLYHAGPIFQNRDGRAVKFEDLDFDLSVRLLNMVTFPIEDRAGFMGFSSTQKDVVAGNGTQEAGEMDGVEEMGDTGHVDGQGEATDLPGPDGFRWSLKTPYEAWKIADPEKMTVRRTQPSIEKSWHVSKVRKARSVQEWEGRRSLPLTDYGRFFSAGSQGRHKALWRTDVKLRRAIERILE